MPNALSVSFVEQLYEGVLFRVGSADEVNAWASALDAGTLSQSQIVSDIVTSGEAQSDVLPIIRLYEAVLERAPDQAGLGGWVAAFRGGMSLDQIATGFAGSAEFEATHGGQDVKAFVDSLYNTVLARAPDAAGEQGWVDYLSQHGNTADAQGQVVLAFANSPEFIAVSTGSNQNWLAAAGVSGTYQQGSSSGSAFAVVNVVSTSPIIYVNGHLTGAPSSGDYAMTIVAHPIAGEGLFFINAVHEGWLTGAAATSQVNVSSATTLSAALDLAASRSAAMAGGTLAPDTGVYDWFQFGGNTYVVEAINNGTVAAPHAALGSGDAIVELVGLINVTGSAGHTLVI